MKRADADAVELRRGTAREIAGSAVSWPLWIAGDGSCSRVAVDADGMRRLAADYPRGTAMVGHLV